MGCRENISNICNETTDSKCVDYTGELGDQTKIGTNCVSQYQVNEDLYKIVDSISEDLNTRELRNICIEYSTESLRIKPSDAIRKNGEEICLLKDRTEILENKDYGQIDITEFGLNFRCLSDPCGDPITKLGQLLQIMINRICPTK